ncbi:zinc-dependent metalloprotease [Timonella sp. A28]|uniref:zinc-dependent metalloprotease n=1 Tax=Timonella sp. A28 TaxID=3442640 RepID=UPI003EB71022
MKIMKIVRDAYRDYRTPQSSQTNSPWERAARLAGSIVRPGPDVSRLKAEEVVATLREQSSYAMTMVQELAQLTPHPEHAKKHGDVLCDVSIVDRAGWAMWAARGMEDLIGANRAEPIDNEPDPTDVNPSVEITAVLTFLAQKTLGQFIPHQYTGNPNEEGELGNLVLVAPNILATQRSMAVNLTEFSLWVSTHELTHALQFAHAPWLAQYMRDIADELIRGFDSETSLVQWARALSSSARGQQSVIEYMLSEVQHAKLEEITALMSVLEGHADVVMDLIPSSVLPAQRVLRRKFESRKRDLNRTAELFSRVSGLDAKKNQYKVGAQFVRGVRSRAGLESFNRVFIGPEYLPTLDELSSPAQWLERTAHIPGDTQGTEE